MTGRRHFRVVSTLRLDGLNKGKIHFLKVGVQTDAMGRALNVPVMVAKGALEGPVLGLTAAVHGNELNGIPIIHEIFKWLNPKNLKGTLVAVPVFNVSGYLLGDRFYDGVTDLNRIMPGRSNGNSAELYCYNILHKIVGQFSYLLDLHTASFGRANSLYVRADLSNPICAKMAILQAPQIILNNEGESGTLRKVAYEMGIYGITVEVGDPHLFQKTLIHETVKGIRQVMKYLRMLPMSSEKRLFSKIKRPTICSHSYWIYSTVGGILKVHVQKAEKVRKGKTLATIYDIFGNKVKDIVAKEKAVVIAISTNPACQSGSRIVHLGIEDEKLLRAVRKQAKALSRP